MEEKNVEEINNLLNPISFILEDRKEFLIIKSKFDLSNKSNFGLVLILLGGIFMTYILISKFKLITSENFNDLSELAVLIIFMVLALSLVIGGILGIYSVNTDFVKVTSSYLEFKSSSLKSTKIKLNSNFRIIKRERTEYINSTRTIGSTFRIIELYIKDECNQKRILYFHMNESEASKAQKIGKELMSVILQKKRYLQHVLKINNYR